MSTVETTTFDLHDLREHVAAGDPPRSAPCSPTTSNGP